MPPNQKISRQVESQLTPCSPSTHAARTTQPSSYHPCFPNTYANRYVDFAMRMINMYELFQTGTGNISSKAESRSWRKLAKFHTPRLCQHWIKTTQKTRVPKYSALPHRYSRLLCFWGYSSLKITQLKQQKP